MKNNKKSAKAKSALPSMQKFHCKDADPEIIRNSTLAVLGFGSQGHAHALALEESGYEVIIGLHAKSKSRKIARERGFRVYSVAGAVRRADVILVALPDMVQPGVYEKEIAPNLATGKTLLFSHGLTIHFGLIKVPEGVNVGMVAPKGPGHLVLRLYREGKGIPALIAAHQGGVHALQVALAWARGIGATRAGVLVTTFKEETETDLFGEQAVLCGGSMELVKAGYETLVAAGYRPEMAYFECLHELKLICDLMYESGIAGMRFSISETAKYGDITRGRRVVGKASRTEMKKILADIQSGKFTREWVREYKAGKPNYNRLLARAAQHPIERVGAELRSMMPWMSKKNIRGVQAAYAN